MLSAYLALQIGIKNKYSPPAKDREKRKVDTVSLSVHNCPVQFL
jgi:hypothetical protein